jgi:transcriptional regulator with XRE-family HTH domain
MGQRDSQRLRKILGDNLRSLRTERGYSQEAFAAKAGLHRTFIGSVERAECNISLDNLGKLAAALGVPASRLLDEAGE